MSQKDSRYVSREPSEIGNIAIKFGAPAPLIFYIQNEMSVNNGTYSKRPKGLPKGGIFKPRFTPGKVLRSKLYSVLKEMGYKKNIKHEY